MNGGTPGQRDKIQQRASIFAPSTSSRRTSTMARPPGAARGGDRRHQARPLSILALPTRERATQRVGFHGAVKGSPSDSRLLPTPPGSRHNQLRQPPGTDSHRVANEVAPQEPVAIIPGHVFGKTKPSTRSSLTGQLLACQAEIRPPIALRPGEVEGNFQINASRLEVGSPAPPAATQDVRRHAPRPCATPGSQRLRSAHRGPEHSRHQNSSC